MENRDIKSENQVILFDLIQKTLPSNFALVDVISDLLGVGVDAAYRRIRGSKPISFEEAIKLCRHFQISMDSLADVVANKDYIQCHYLPLNLENLNNYQAIIKDIASNFDRIKMPLENEILLSAIDIPLFNILLYKELTLFKIFSWSNSIYGSKENYEEFVNIFNSFELILSCHEKMARNYLQIPSSEIWTTTTIDTFLKLLNHHFEMLHFSDKKTPLLLCDQLLDLMNTMQSWAEKGAKGQNETPYKFYVSETDIGNTFILFKNSQRMNCMVRLYTINGLNISDERFCQETESWLRNLSRRATLLSEASEKERFKFFNAQKQKIQLMMDKIQSNS